MNPLKTQKPFKTYLGGKESSGVFQIIINNIPKHKTLIIPFLGNCAVFRNIKRADNTILIDADPRIIESWYTIIKKEVGSCSLLNDDAISYLQKYREDSDHTFIYADPPYPLQTRSSSNTKYEYDLTDEQHISLLTVLRDLKCKVAISTYPNELYFKMLFGWKCILFKSQTRYGQRTELLYMNYDINELELHDYSYLGKNFRERERIKKKVHRHTALLMRLDRLESLAIMEKLSVCSNIIKGDPVPIIINDYSSGGIYINKDASSSTNLLNRASKVTANQSVFSSEGLHVT